MKASIKNITYPFSEYGIREMESDSLELIFSALARESKSAIEKLYINVSIGNRKIVIPTYAEAFERFFDCLKEIEKELREEGTL